MLYATALIALGALARAQNVLFEGSNYRATVYYDVAGGDVCGAQNNGPFPQNWAVTSGINSGMPYCTEGTGKTLDQYHSNQIVAMNIDMMSNDKAKWCGKEVQLFKNGKQITIDEGPFILYDGCAACASANIIDLSAKAFVAASDDGKCGNNPEGITVKVIDNNLSASLEGGAANQGSESDLVPPAPAPSSDDSTSSSSDSASSDSASPSATPSSSDKQHGDAKKFKADNFAAQAPTADGSSAAQTPAESPAAETPAAKSPAAESPARHTNPTPRPAAAAASDSAPAQADKAADSAAPVPSAGGSDSSSSSGASCTFGKWQCDGLALQVCNMAGQTETKWETIANCASECSFTLSGSAICQ